MAIYYVYSGAVGSGDGSSWANAYTTLAAALAVESAGDTIYVAEDHSESTAGGVTLSFSGTPDNLVKVLCVQRVGGSVPPIAADLRTTAVVTATGANDITLNGQAYIYGIRFTGASGSSVTTGLRVGLSGGSYLYLKNCVLKKGTTNNTTNPLFGSTSSPGATVVLDGTVLEGVSTGLSWRIGNQGSSSVSLVWKNTPNGVAGPVPTTLFSFGGGTFQAYGVDLSALGAGSSLFSAGATLMAQLVNCKLGVGVAIVEPQTSHAQLSISMVNCASGDVNYKFGRYFPEGTDQTETTIVRTGGASDGTTSFSRKMVSSSLASYGAPFPGMSMVVWNTTVGSPITVSIPVLTDNVTLTDADAWLEVDYVGDASFPLGSTASDSAATILTTPVNQPTDAVSVWTTTGIGTPVQQILSVTFTPQAEGYLYVRVVLAKPSVTVYADPLPQVT